VPLCYFFLVFLGCMLTFELCTNVFFFRDVYPEI